MTPVSDPLLTSADLETLRGVLVAGLQIDGVGVGGASWVVETTSGDGVATPVTRADGATITAYLYQKPATRMAPAQPGVLVGDATWYVVVVSGTVAVGQVVRSAADGRRVRLGARVADPLYPTYLAEAL